MPRSGSARRRLALAMLVTAAPLAAQGAGWASQGVVDVPALVELSGLAVMPGAGGRIWAHNDSGNAPHLYAFDRRGRALGAVRVSAPESATFDWEDIAAFEHQGRPWLALGDIGDNVGLRRDVAVLLFPEPVPGAAGRVPQRMIRFRYEDGAADAEALAVDAAAGEILVLQKSRRLAGLYVVSIEGPDRQTARRVAQLPPRWQRADGTVVTREAIVAMDLRADGRQLALLDARAVHLFARWPGQAWREVLEAPPQHSLPLPRDGSRHFEAVAFDDDGALWVAAEGRTPRLWRHAPAKDQGAGATGASTGASAGGASGEGAGAASAAGRSTASP